MSIKLDFAKQLKAQIDVWQAQIENAQGELEKPTPERVPITTKPSHS
jgi:hypothetical protein